MFNIGRNSVLLTAAGLTLLNRGLLRAGVRQRIDGWRRAAGVVLRGEESTFVLSAFGLNAASSGQSAAPGTEAFQALLAARLDRFLLEQPACRVAVRRGPTADRAEPVAAPVYTLVFEPFVPGAARFIPPTTWTPASDAPAVEGTIAPLMNLVCRAAPNGAVDIWARLNHVAADGAPMQEVLSALESAWGTAEQVVYPSPEEFQPCIEPRPLPSRPGLAEIQFFARFDRLLAWRRLENQRLPQPMTLAAAILWRLSHAPEFQGLHFGTTVDVEPREGLARAVGVVVVRPAEFAHRADGLSRYVTAFNRSLELARRRESSAVKTIDGAAFIPASMARRLLRHGLKRVPSAFGQVGLTMIRDARVFGAPIAEAGHERGFIAIGGVTLPTADGGSVGCVSVKGKADDIARWPGRIREAIEAA